MVTQKDVAKEAGVSIATVSAVINNNKFVSKPLKEEVSKAIEKLNYEPNIIARNLKVKKSNTIGIIIGNIVSQTFAIMAKAAEDVANKYGYNLIVCNSDDDPQKELNYLRVLRSNRVGGIILTATGKNIRYIKRLKDSGMIVVLMDRLLEDLNNDAVLIDNENGAYSAVKYLIERGLKRISIICGPINITTGKERFSGYVKALNESGIPEDKNLIKFGSYKKENGIKSTLELLKGTQKPDAIFTTNLDITLGALEALKKLRVNIPEDLSIIGFDNSEWLRIMTPAITVVSHPIYGFGAASAKLLFKRINNNDKDYKPIIKRLKTNLLIRSSVK